MRKISKPIVLIGLALAVALLAAFSLLPVWVR